MQVSARVCGLAVAAALGLAPEARAVIATLRCAPGCCAEVRNITITKNQETVFPPDPRDPPLTMNCCNPAPPHQPVDTADLGPIGQGYNDFHATFSIECEGTDLESDDCSLFVPGSQVPWAVQFNVNAQGASCNTYGDNPPSPARSRHAIAAPLALGADAAFLLEESPCVPSETTLCIDDIPGDKRFRVTMDFFSPPRGLAGDAKVIGLAALGVERGGILYFSNPKNPEVLAKVLDGCLFNDHYWFFASAGTDVGYDLAVTDTVLDHTRTYHNNDGKAALPIQDTSAMDCE